MCTRVPALCLPVHLGTPTLSVHQVLSISGSLPCTYSIWAWEGQVCLKANSFSLLNPGSWSTSVPKFMVINATEKVCVMFRACSLLICMARSERPEESVFWKSCCEVANWVFGFRWITRNIFKWFSAQYPNMWFLISTNSKFYKVAESLLWINSYRLVKDAAEVGFHSLGGAGTGLPKQNVEAQWKERLLPWQ